jgi:hypothetical protein
MQLEVRGGGFFNQVPRTFRIQLSSFMTRASMSRRPVVSAVAETHLDAKARKKVPLTRISNNQRLRTIVDRPAKQTVSQPALSVEVPASHIFRHAEIGIGNPEDPQDVAKFEHIIYRSLRTKELSAARLRFAQPEITLRDRHLLIDALDRFHFKLGLTTNGFYRFLGILDRYLSIAPVSKTQLRVIGCASLLIASKIEDIYPAQSKDLIQLSEHDFTRTHLFATEIQVINAIHFDTTFATPLFFLTQFMRIREQTKVAQLLGRYILEICQTHDLFFGVAPSLIASVATMVARILGGEEAWPDDIAGYTAYTAEELAPYVAAVRSMLINRDREESRFMRRKYCSEPFLGVADVKIPPLWQ